MEEKIQKYFIPTCIPAVADTQRYVSTLPVRYVGTLSLLQVTARSPTTVCSLNNSSSAVPFYISYGVMNLSARLSQENIFQDKIYLYQQAVVKNMSHNSGITRPAH